MGLSVGPWLGGSEWHLPSLVRNPQRIDWGWRRSQAHHAAERQEIVGAALPAKRQAGGTWGLADILKLASRRRARGPRRPAADRGGQRPDRGAARPPEGRQAHSDVPRHRCARHRRRSSQVGQRQGPLSVGAPPWPRLFRAAARPARERDHNSRCCRGPRADLARETGSRAQDLSRHPPRVRPRPRHPPRRTRDRQ